MYKAINLFHFQTKIRGSVEPIFLCFTGMLSERDIGQKELKLHVEAHENYFMQ